MRRSLRVGAAWPEVRAHSPPSPGRTELLGPICGSLCGVAFFLEAVAGPQWRPSWHGGRRRTKLRDLPEAWRDGRRERVLVACLSAIVGQWDSGTVVPCSLLCSLVVSY